MNAVELFLFWGPLFMVCQYIACLWGLDFMGNWFVAFQYKTIHYFVKRSWGLEFVGKGNPRIPQTLIPH